MSMSSVFPCRCFPLVSGHRDSFFNFCWTGDKESEIARARARAQEGAASSGGPSRLSSALPEKRLNENILCLTVPERSFRAKHASRKSQSCLSELFGAGERELERKRAEELESSRV